MTPVAQLPLTLGQHLHLAGDPNPWTVKAVSEHFAALTRPVSQQDHDEAEWQADAEEELWENPYEDMIGEPMYTVLDWRNGVRGPCNLSGQGWGDGTYTEAECAAMLAECESGELEVSRNRVRIEFGPVAW
jgi:hypothetical protein